MTDHGLHSFRSDVPGPTDEAARRVYARATRRRSRVHGRIVLVPVVAALVLVPAAFAVAHLFEGTPAPPDVSTTFTGFNRMADTAVQDGFRSRAAHADVTRAYGVLEVETPDGPEDMWAAPNDVGSTCWFIDFANDPAGPDGAFGSGGCDDPEHRPDSNVSWGDYWVAGHPELMTVYGMVFTDATSVDVSFDDGTTVNLPVVEHLFLTSTGKDEKVASVTPVNG